MKKNTNISALFLIFISHLFLFIETQSEIDDDSALKALTCVSIVTQKYKKGEEEPTSYSPIVLSCYMKITTEQARKALADLEEGMDELGPDEIEALTDLDNLKDFSDEEIRQKSEELEKTIQEFQKIDEDYEKSQQDELEELIDDDEDEGNDDDYYGDEDDEFERDRKKKISKKGILNLIKKGFTSLFSVLGSIWYAIFFLIGLYFFLMAMRKSSEDIDKSKNKKTEDIKDDNKNKDDNKDENDKSKENDKEIEKDKAKTE